MTRTRTIRYTYGVYDDGEPYEHHELIRPLSVEEVHKLADIHLQTRNHDGALVVLGLEDFAQAIEKAHGIR